MKVDKLNQLLENKRVLAVFIRLHKDSKMEYQTFDGEDTSDLYIDKVPPNFLDFVSLLKKNELIYVTPNYNSIRIDKVEYYYETGEVLNLTDNDGQQTPPFEIGLLKTEKNPYFIFYRKNLSDHSRPIFDKLKIGDKISFTVIVKRGAKCPYHLTLISNSVLPKKFQPLNKRIDLE